MPDNVVIMSVLCVYAIATTAILPFVCCEYCARFQFLALPSSKEQYIFAVNTTIAFPFYLVNQSCHSLDNYTVRIYKSFSPACNVYFKFGKCQEPQQKGVCHCNHSANSFFFKKTLNKADEGEWRWSAIGDDLNEIAECVTTFRITVPAQITNLTVNNNNNIQYIMYRKESVMIICSWINGDPPTTVRLMDSRKKELNSSDHSGYISFRYPNIHGDSAGSVRCEVKGSNTSKSVTLIIKPIVLNLTLGGETGSFLADRNKSVPIVCSWENGYPHSSARLTDSDGGLLSSSNESGNISYTLAAVDCKNSGIIRCDADGSEKNVSVRLIVKCPPTFMNQSSNMRIVKVGTEPIITFPTLAHTAMLTECKITSVNSTSPTTKSILNVFICYLPGTNKSESLSLPTQITKGSNYEEISCSCSLTGEIPYMILTLKMHHKFTEGIGGLWDLSVSNQEGSSHQEFILEVAAEDSKPDQSLRVVAIVMPITMLAAVVGGVIAYVFHSKENQQKITEIAEFAGLGLYSTSLPVKRKSDLKVPDDPSPSPDTESSDPTSEESITSTESDEAEESRVQVFNKNSNDDRNMKIVCKGGDMKVVLYIKGRSGKGKSSQVITAAITENDDDDNEITPLPQFCSTKAAKKKSRKRKSAVGEDYLTPCPPRYSTLPPPPESSGTDELEIPLDSEDNASELYTTLAEEHYLTID